MGSGFLSRQIVSIRVKKLNKTNLVASSHIIKEKASLPVDVRRSKTLLLPDFNQRQGGHAGRRKQINSARKHFNALSIKMAALSRG